MTKQVEFFAERHKYGRRIALYATRKNHQRNVTEVALPPAYRDHPEGEAFAEPTLLITPEEAQSLMDELWHCGLRPTEGAGSAGSMAATERHLADMRQLSTRLLDKVLGS